ncbi:unnamed protein product [Ectocarpus sp. 4 AP-2014]
MKWPLAAVLVGTARSPATGFHVNPIPVRSKTTVAATAGVEQGNRITAYRYSRPSRHRVAAARASAVAGLGVAADGVESSLQHLTQPGEDDEDEDQGAFFSVEESLPPTTPPAPAKAAPAQPAATEDGNTNAVISTVVSDEDNKAPIDWVLSRRLPQHSRRFYRKALEAGDVKVDGRKVKRFIRVKRGARISVDLGRQQQQQQGASAVAAATTTPPPTLVFPQRLPRLRVVFEDDHLFVVMKPAGMICQPCAAAPRGTVLHGLMYHMVQSGQLKEGADTMAAAANTLSQGIVQRLDKQTSGIMVVAKTLAASSKISALFRKGKVKKQYLAVCHGDPGFDSVVDAPLYRRSSGKVGAVEPWEAEEFRAKEAQTRVRNVATARGLSLCRADILTGRMHQVRVHLKWIGCPIVGDREYGDPEANFRVSKRSAHRAEVQRPLLHSVSLEFIHPFTNKPMSFKAPMPPDMWETAQNILRVSGTPEQQEAFGKLQELRQSQADEAAPVGGRGAPRMAAGGGGGGKKRPGNRSKGARAAFEAVAKSEIFEQ